MKYPEANKIVDLDQYPVHEPSGSAYAELVTRLRAQLHQNQICTLPGFLREETRGVELKNAIGKMPEGNRAHSFRNIYLERSGDDSLPKDHPRNILSEASYTMLGAHLLDESSSLKKLYYWDNFRKFVEDVTESGELFPSADPYQPVNVLCHKPGDKSAWHFDSDNSFTMTLMLQAPEKGGVFEIAPDIRTETDPRLNEVRDLVLGNREMVQQHSRDERELVIFRGCNSAHRVTEIEGSVTRMMCVMVYEDRPGVIGDPVVNETVYGVKPI